MESDQLTRLPKWTLRKKIRLCVQMPILRLITLMTASTILTNTRILTGSKT